MKSNKADRYAVLPDEWCSEWNRDMIRARLDLGDEIGKLDVFMTHILANPARFPTIFAHIMHHLSGDSIIHE